MYQMDQASRTERFTPVQSGFAEMQTDYSGRVETAPVVVEEVDAPLGAARAQVHEQSRPAR